MGHDVGRRRITIEPVRWSPEGRVVASWAAGLLVGGAIAASLAWLGCPVGLY